MLLGLLVAAVVAKEWTFNDFSLADGATHMKSLGGGTMDVDYLHLTYTYPAFGCNTGSSKFKIEFKDADYNSVYMTSGTVSTGSNVPSFSSVGKATYMSLTNENSVCDVHVSGYIEYSSFTPAEKMEVQACGSASCRSSHSYPVGICTHIGDFCNGNKFIAYGVVSGYTPGSSAMATYYKDSECSEYDATVFFSCTCATWDGLTTQLDCSTPATHAPSTLAPPTPTPGTTWGFSDITIPAGGTHTLSFGTKDVNYMHLTYTYPQGGCSGDTMFNIDFTAPGVNSMYVQQVPPTGKNVPASGGVGYVSDASIKNMNTACDVVVSGYIQYSSNYPPPSPHTPLPTPLPTPVPTPVPTPAPAASSMTVVACGAASCRSSHSYPVGVCAPIRDFCNGNQLIAYGIAGDYFPGSSAEVALYRDTDCGVYVANVTLGCSCTSYEGFSGQLVCNTPPSSGGSGGGTSIFLYVGIGGGALVVLGVIGAVVGYVIWKRGRASEDELNGADYDAMSLQTGGGRGH